MLLTTNFLKVKKFLKKFSFWVILFFLNSSIQAESFFNPGLERIQKGIQQYHKKDLKSSLEEFQKAEEIFPNDPRLDFNIGSVLAGSGRYRDSIPYFQKSLNDNDPKLRSKSYFNMGNVFATENQKKKAMDSYRKALEENPANELARRNMELLLKPNNNQNQPNSQSSNNDPISNGKSDPTSNGKGFEGKQNNSKELNQKPYDKQNSKSESNSNSKNSLSRKEAERIMDSLSSDKIQRNKSKEFFQFQRDKFW